MNDFFEDDFKEEEILKHERVFREKIINLIDLKYSERTFQ